MTKKVVTIGGGTGSFTLLTGLKTLNNIDIKAIVPSTDSGGSSGRLKDEFGYLPPGDIRQCLIALAEDEEEQYLLRKLFSYRFDKGENGLKGHNFGNLFLTVLNEVVGDEIKAIRIAEKLLNTRGKIYPIALGDYTLVAEYENGSIIETEHNIDEPQYPHDGRLRIKKLYTKPIGKIHAESKKAIEEADLIIVGPGDLYTSLIANFVIKGVKESLKNTKGKIVFNINLVTKYGQTYSFSAQDHINEFIKYTQIEPDYILINNKALPKDIVKKYLVQNDSIVIDDIKSNTKMKVIRTDLIATEKYVNIKGDVLKRSLIRHDPIKIAKIVNSILNNQYA